MMSELIQSTHLKRKAVVYIRQSTPHQVVSNQESLRLQYALRQRARELGWHEADIDVIDADLGLSGASAAHRSGFKELVGRVGLSEVGLILSIDGRSPDGVRSLSTMASLTFKAPKCVLSMPEPWPLNSTASVPSGTIWSCHSMSRTP